MNNDLISIFRFSDISKLNTKTRREKKNKNFKLSHQIAANLDEIIKGD